MPEGGVGYPRLLQSLGLAPQYLEGCARAYAHACA